MGGDAPMKTPPLQQHLLSIRSQQTAYGFHKLGEFNWHRHELTDTLRVLREFWSCRE